MDTWRSPGQGYVVVRGIRRIVAVPLLEAVTEILHAGGKLLEPEPNTADAESLAVVVVITLCVVTCGGHCEGSLCRRLDVI
jgi:hypothetical protein